MKNFYGTGLFDTPFVIKRWKLSWKFPFINKIVAWRGTVLDAQKELNKLKYGIIDQAVKKKLEK